jgi:hypothetical protein
VREGAQVRTVVLRGQDGYRTTLPLSEFLGEDSCLPGWFLRLAYRPLIGFTVDRFAKALALHQPEDLRRP